MTSIERASWVRFGQRPVLIAWKISWNRLSGGRECRVRALTPERERPRARVSFFSSGITLPVPSTDRQLDGILRAKWQTRCPMKGCRQSVCRLFRLEVPIGWPARLWSTRIDLPAIALSIVPIAGAALHCLVWGSPSCENPYARRDCWTVCRSVIRRPSLSSPAQ